MKQLKGLNERCDPTEAPVDKRQRGEDERVKGAGRSRGGLYASVAENNVPKAAVFHLPSRTFREPRLGLFDGIRKRVDVRRERRGRRRVYARDVVVRACLRNERAVEEKGGRGSLMGREPGDRGVSRAGTHFALARASGALDDMAKIGRAEFTERGWERSLR